MVNRIAVDGDRFDILDIDKDVFGFYRWSDHS